jgi:hypothetical protein
VPFVLEACYHALTYSIEHDPHELERRRNSVCADELDSVNKAIAVIREFSNKCPDIIGWALGVAPPQPGEKFDPNDSLQEDILLAGLLKKLARSLECTRGKHIAKYHRMRQGNLIYPAPVDQYAARPNIDVLGLIFELVFLFRRWTSLVRGRREPGLPYPGEVRSNEHSAAANNDLPQIFSFPDQRWFSGGRGYLFQQKVGPTINWLLPSLMPHFMPQLRRT